MTSLLTMRRMVVIDLGQGLLIMSFSHMMRTTTMNAETGAHFPKAWEIMRRVMRSTKFPDRLSRARLREGDFLDGSLSLRSQCTMAEQTL